MSLTDEQIASRLAALAEERVGYERRLLVAAEREDADLEAMLKARLSACDQSVARLKGDAAPVAREKDPAEKQTRLKGAGKQTRLKGNG